MEFQYFWRIPLASQPPSQPRPAREPRPARQPVTAGQPATVSQPASASNRHWISFSTKLLPEVQNRPLLLMRFFNNSIVEYRWPASQPERERERDRTIHFPNNIHTRQTVTVRVFCWGNIREERLYESSRAVNKG